MKERILQAARDAFRERLSGDASVSDHTRNAQHIATAWKKACVALDESRISHEVPITPEIDQRLDILDRQEMCAYEFKVSGKNAHSEFYKNVVKVILWNESKEKKIKQLVFITDAAHGRRFLDTPMPRALIKFVEQHGLLVEIQYLTAAP